jgi:predicted DNA-binding protein YlxM (UPF0122 family)
MKTIKQIADELGVTKQAIFYRINKPPLSNTVKSLMSKFDGVLMVSLDGEKLIRQAFKEKIIKDFGDKESSNFDDSFDGRTENILREMIQVLKQENEFLKKQVEDLTLTVKVQAESINYGRQNELAETIVDRQQRLIGEQQPRKSFFKRLFERK